MAKKPANGKLPWMKFYPSDWRADPALRMCSIAARGLWMEMLCVMHDATPSGSLVINGRQVGVRQIAAMAGISLKEAEPLLQELDDAGVFSRDEDGTIFSRRMRRDIDKFDRVRESGSSGGNPEIRRGTVPKELRVRPYKRSDAPEKTRRIFERDGGKCHWCEVPLAWDYIAGATNFFHVDHVVAICDGGTNDEQNLVAACATCNHKRARNILSETDPTASMENDPTPTKVTVGNEHDTNQIQKKRHSDTNRGLAYVGAPAGARAATTQRQRPEARKKEDTSASAESVPSAPDLGAAAERDLVRRIRVAMGAEPVIATADYPTGILRMLADGATDGSIVEDDVFAGIVTMFEKCEHGFRCKRYGQVENWIRGAARDRLAGKPRVQSVGTKAAAVPSSMIRGIEVPDARIQARVDRFYRLGEWPDDVRDRWGPAPGDGGCCIPPKFLKPKVAA